ncbi:MAG: phosphotransferase [Deltaproteobacteria bacterium]|nr:phosphotransferase [Deltaproteobacteria bacterium]
MELKTRMVSVKAARTGAPKLDDEAAVRAWLGRLGRSVAVTAIPGDASSRRYFRVRTRNSSFICMKMQAFADVGEQLPFIQVQSHLSRLGVNVPQIIDLESKKGLILLADLGDETLLKRLERVSKKRDQLVWFKRAIDLVLNMQIVATRNTAPIDAYGLYFDEEKLMWEVGFTLAHFYNGALARNIPAKEQKVVESYFKLICKRLASQEWYFTHRDYHGRNVMVQGNDLYMIDFQDARLGCPQYDLASLLRDSYYQLEEEVVYELLDYYLRQKEKIEGAKENHREFTRVFDLMSIQRNFKAIGSFASFYMKRQDVRYLKFIGNTFENIRRNLLKFPELDELRCMLFRYYYF